jgi:ribosomal protein L7Ae-like RNA K-turn-binding protein
MANERFYSFLGLAAKGGKLAYGAQACEAGVKNGKLRLVLVDGGASENTKKLFADKCRHYGVDIIILDEIGLLGKSLGKPENKITGIADAGFAKSVLQHMN